MICMSELRTGKDTKKLLIFLIPVILSISFIIWNLWFNLWFWIVLIIWFILYLLFFVRSSIKNVYILWIIAAFILTFSILVSYKIIFNDDTDSISSGLEKSADGIILDDCTSTANDRPIMVSGWKSTIYSAELSKTTSPDASEANNVRTFSYNGIKNKTDANSIYTRVEKADGSYITGYGTTMEACSTDNKTTKSYTTADTTYVASDNVVASTHYLHGGSYLHGAGDYRIDVYLKTTDGKWHLIDRMSGITVSK